MKKILFLIIIFIFTNCSRPLYIKDRHFNCPKKEYKIDSDLKELVYKSLKRAVVIQKDIPDYRLLWKKHKIYVADEYQTEDNHFQNRNNWEESLQYLTSNDIPYKIENVSFCLKSKKELQKIANRTWEDFLHISFSLIDIKEKNATIKINNTWIVSNKHSNKIYLSGGGYVAIYVKIDGKWEFKKIKSSWIS